MAREQKPLVITMADRITNPTEIIRCLLRDGWSPEDGARYCRRIALEATYSAFAPRGDGPAYYEAARRLEAQAKEEKLALEHVEALEEENQRLAARVLELEKTIINLTT